MAEKIPLTKINLDFTPKQTLIDYFHIDRDDLSMGEFEVDEVNLNLHAGQYLTMENLNTIDHNKKETIVFNVPVGKGKTERCYDLIKKYYSEGYYVIVCSPFLKLVEKDYEKLKEGIEIQNIFKYTFIEKNKNEYRSSLTWGVEARIQVMTINCLLGNPGDDEYEQAFVKKDFLNYLFQTINSKERKIIFFFDEIHESVHNFINEFIPRLVKWHTLAHKCYISSATHTPASIPIIRYISLLTDCKIKIYFTDRVKEVIQANLHLHISTETYSKQRLSPLNRLIELIHEYRGNGRKVNILSGHKSIVEALTAKDNISPLGKSIKLLNPNICTGSTSNEFDQHQNNIGTNFKTGVNIESGEGVLIVILPAIVHRDSKYGVFQDGVSSVIQSLGRLRKGGDVHIFMYSPNAIIDLQNHKTALDERLCVGKSDAEYHSQTEAYSIFRNIYDQRVKGIETELTLLKDIGFEEVSPELKYHYPTFQEELIIRSQKILQKKFEIFGRGLSSYVLWAAINNQFCNATLQKIDLITKSYKIIEFTSDHLINELLEVLTTEQTLALRGLDFQTAYSNVFALLKTSTTQKIDEENNSEVTETVYNKFRLDGENKSLNDLARSSTFSQGIISMISFLKTGIMQKITKETYIHTCIQNALDYNDPEIPDNIDGYRSLNTVKQQFIDFIRNESIRNRADEMLIHIDSYSRMDDLLIADCIHTIVKVKANDPILKNVFSFLQDIENVQVVDVDVKRKIWMEFRKLFTTISDQRKKHQAEKKYYLVPAQMASNFVNSGIKFI